MIITRKLQGDCSLLSQEVNHVFDSMPLTMTGHSVLSSAIIDIVE